jgi:hypothetical protein
MSADLSAAGNAGFLGGLSPRLPYPALSQSFLKFDFSDSINAAAIGGMREGCP